MLMARVLWADIKDTDFRRRENGQFPSRLIGKYSLEAFGHRLGLYKGEFEGPWDRWSQEMQDYMDQDVRVTVRLWKKALLRLAGVGDKDPIPFSEQCIELEHDVARIVLRQEAWGFRFNVEKARKLYGHLVQKRCDLERDLRTIFPPWFRGREVVTVKKTRVMRKGVHSPTTYHEEAVYQKIELIDFNPSSRDHIADRLIKLRGWEPAEFGKDGKPTVDDTVLSTLPYPEAKPLSEYLMIQKRIGMLAEGRMAWLKMERNGRLHGSIVTNGAVTGRMTHMEPNMGQVPSSGSPYGHECRDLFEHSLGRLVGCDADALELRCLAGYLAPIDGGAYIKTVLEGNKDLGTDMHSVNCRALGLDPKAEYLVDGTPTKGRDIAKTWFYAFIYGAGNEKLGWIMGKRGDPTNPDHWTKRRDGSRVDKVAAAAGERSRKTFLRSLPALGTLVQRIAKRVETRGFLIGLDGRKLHVRSAHAALNTLLQSAGAILMKQALVFLDKRLQEAGLVPGVDYEFAANVHDEWQIDVAEKWADFVGKTAEQAIIDAGTHFDFGCPLDGQSVIGQSWKDTH